MTFPKTKFLKELEEHVRHTERGAISGSLENMKEYGEHCGFVRGIEIAKDLFEELWEAYYKTVQNEEID